MQSVLMARAAIIFHSEHHKGEEHKREVSVKDECEDEMEPGSR